MLLEEHGVKFSFISIGGGFASPNTLKAQYLPGEQTTPSFGRYAQAISDGLAELNYAPRDLPTLVLETGRALVDDAGYLISSTVANKRLPDGHKAMVIDAGVNIMFTSFWYNHEVVPAQSFMGSPEPTIIYGPLCMNIDVMRESFMFPHMNIGDKLVFKNVGAYNVTQWMQFITYRPAVVLIGPDGRHETMRRRENLETLLRQETVPSWL
jgi:diaminopimelate decarboxylase